MAGGDLLLAYRCWIHAYWYRWILLLLNASLFVSVISSVSEPGWDDKTVLFPVIFGGLLWNYTLLFTEMLLYSDPLFVNRFVLRMSSCWQEDIGLLLQIIVLLILAWFVLMILTWFVMIYFNNWWLQEALAVKQLPNRIAGWQDLPSPIISAKEHKARHEKKKKRGEGKRQRTSRAVCEQAKGRNRAPHTAENGNERSRAPGESDVGPTDGVHESFNGPRQMSG